MKKIKLLKSITPILGAGLIASAIVPLTSCRFDDEKQPEKPVKKGVKLNMDAAPNDVSLVEKETPLSLVSNKEETVNCNIYVSDPKTIDFEYRVGDSKGESWIVNWTQVTATGKETYGLITIPICQGNIVQFRARNLSQVGALNSYDPETQAFSGVDIVIGDAWEETPGEGITLGGSMLSMVAQKQDDESWYGCEELQTEYCFYGLFRQSSELIHVAADFLPFKKLTPHCYEEMFYNCLLLQDGPALPATELAESCYCSMFGSCPALQSSPYLPATKLVSNCYANMFGGCTGIMDVSLAYVGNFEDEYFNSWLGYIGTQKGVIHYNGADKTTGESALPAYFTLDQDEDWINKWTVTFEVVPDDETSILSSGKSKLRCYKDDTPANVAAALSPLHQAKVSGDTWSYDKNPTTQKAIDWNKANAELVYEQTDGGKLTPVYGFTAADITDCANVIFDSASIITVTPASNQTVEFAVVNQQDPTADPKWEAFESGVAKPFSARQQIRLRATQTAVQSASNYTNIKISGKVRLAGTVMTLLQTSLGTTPDALSKDFACYKLFEGSKGLTQVTDNFLPSTTITPMCYACMFKDCNNITTVPKIGGSTETINRACSGAFYHMFENCSSITKFGELPVGDKIGTAYTTGGLYGTFEGMFSGCSKLTEVAPKNGIPKGTGVQGETIIDAPRLAFNQMFYGCSELLTAPKMSISSVKWEDSNNGMSPFASMFEGCKKMTSAKDVIISIPANGDVSVGYYGFSSMFKDCEVLEQANLPTISTNISYVAAYGMNQMFMNCKKITAAPFDLKSLADKGNHVNDHSFFKMFSGCSSLKRPMIISNSSISPTGTSKDQPDYCYAYMYENCSSLKVKKGSKWWDENLPGSSGNWFFKACYWTSGGSFVEGMFSGTAGSFKGTPSSGGWCVVYGARYSYGWEE